jgi:hypothetical protein
VAEAGELLDERPACIEMLSRGVQRIRGDVGTYKPGKKLVFGLPAMDAWIEAMATVPGVCAECQERSGGGWGCAANTAGRMVDGAGHVVAYLRRAASTFLDTARRPLNDAAGRYASIVELLQPALHGSDGQRYESFVGDLPRQADHARTVLAEIRSLLQTACQDMQRALEVLR